MRIFLAGGTGVIGQRLVPKLIERGHEVTATTRDSRKADMLKRLGATPAIVDGLDRAEVRVAVERAQPEAIIHQMTSLSGPMDLRHFDRWFATTNRLRTEGTAILLDAAAANGSTRFIAQSYTNWTNKRSGSLVKTEDDPLDSRPAPAQASTLAAIKLLEETVTAAPMPGLILRYGNLYGPGASDDLVETVRANKFPIVGNGRGICSWIHVDDATAATVAALERGDRGVYNIVDNEPAAQAEWLPFLASVLGAKSPKRVPAWLAKFFVGEVGVQWLTEGRGSSNAKARRVLGWQPVWSTWRDGFRHALTNEQPVARPATGLWSTP
jgi:nucleoside-diphosphate-sugar epimerase